MGDNMSNENKYRLKNKEYNIFLIICFVGGCILLGSVFLGRVTSMNEDKALKEMISGTNVANYEYPGIDPPDPKYLNTEKGGILAKYDKALSINKDIVGWIRIDDTNINYPVVQANNNDYYLKYNFQNKIEKHGAIFLDYHISPNMSDKNIIVFGHNMIDPLMFNNLEKFKDEVFFNGHRYIYLDSLYKEQKWEVFAVYLLDASKDTMTYKYKSDSDFLEAVAGYKKKAMLKRNIEFKSDDRIVSLITCSYELSNARTVVQARLIND
jgi:sortase B